MQTRTHHRIRCIVWIGTMLVVALTLPVSIFSFLAFTSSHTVAHADSTNLVQNGDFSAGRNNWFDFGGSGAQTTSSPTYQSSAALMMGPGEQGVGQLITLQPNTIYSISAWGLNASPDYSQITLRVTDTNNQNVDYQMSFSTTSWTRQARTITTPANVSQGLVYILKNSGSSNFYADDIFVGTGRDAEVWPFANTSIWNTPVGSNASYTAVPFSWETAFNVDETTSLQVGTDAPRRSVYTQGSTSANDFGACNRDASQGSIGAPQGTAQVPDGFTLDNATRSPNFTPNNPGWVIQGDGRTAVQVQPLARCDAQGPLFGYRATDVDLYGDGIGGAHYGSELSAVGGAIRQGEMIGPGAISHALQLEIWEQKNASNSPAFRWPASNADYNANNLSSSTYYCSLDPCKSNPSAFASSKAGSLLAIPPSVTAASLGIKTAAGLKIFHALQNFGAYIVDGTGWYYQSFGAEYGVRQEMQSAYGYDFNTSSTATGAALDWYNDLAAMFGKLDVIDNNSPTSIGGGGTPSTATAPPFDMAPASPDPVALNRTGWTATASKDSADAAKILDGNLNTYWSTGSAQASGDNVVVDLQSAQGFNAVSFDITSRSAEYPQNYDVYVSNDGSTWGQPISSGTGNGASPSRATFPTQHARYVKIQASSGSLDGKTPWSIGEFNLYTMPVYSPQYGRTGWTATASSTSGCCGDALANALDGNSSTRWSTGAAQTNGQWFQVDMQDLRIFHKLTLDVGGSTNDYPRGYQVYVSSDGSNWGSAIASDAGSSPITTITFPTQLARYVKVVQTGSDPYWWWSIAEFNVIV